MALSAATKRRINREMRMVDLAIRLESNAYAIEKTRQSSYDESLVRLLREAAQVIRGKSA